MDFSGSFDNVSVEQLVFPDSLNNTIDLGSSPRVPDDQLISTEAIVTQGAKRRLIQ